MYRTYKRKLDLTKSQEQCLRSWIGACRTVYNLGLEIKIEAYKKTGKSPSKFDLQKQITELRKDIEWINDVPANTLADTMVRLDNAYKALYKGAGYPKWASKRTFKSISIRQNIHITRNRIKIQKIGWLKMFNDSSVIGSIKSVTIKIEPSGFFACILCEIDKPKFTPQENSIGIDMGLTYFAINSNGGYVNNPSHFKQYERKLRIENRSLARKKKGSKSWYRQVQKIAILHHKIGNVRKDFLHKQSTLIAKANDIVYMEKLNVKGMSKNGNLSKHILDAGWATFRTMLEYKTIVISINPAYTSQTCYQCGLVDALSRNKGMFKCTGCGYTDDADVNAAKNIKRKGIAFVRQREAIACA